ncbi:transcriptional regulator, IclR family [Burkholderia sp. GAS332]|jgi:IclR family KDG regulon transcriptional repressor|uniref:IclR family transcriptional regulator n=1 Tax=Paraburkholderia TaxID=1822464 RepID=UPI00092C1D7D|nr:transcriptional regulator, IclR family [Burkholderia sp. GAS332]
MKTLAKSLDVLAQFASASTDLGVTEISHLTGIDKVIVHRILKTYAEYDYLVQHPTTRRYRLGNAILALAAAQQHSFPPLEAARPHLLQLWKGTSETIHFTVGRKDEMVVLQVYESPLPNRVAADLGEHVPMYCTAAGKQWLAHLPESAIRDYLKRVPLVSRTPQTITDPELLLAELERTRERGYAQDHAEYEDHLHALAAPIVNSRGELLACVALAGPAARLTKRSMTKLAPLLTERAQAISAELAHVSSID